MTTDMPSEIPRRLYVGQRFRVDPRKLWLSEVIRLKRSYLWGIRQWLVWKLGLKGDASYEMNLPTMRDTNVEWSLIPNNLADPLLQLQREAEATGFTGSWPAMVTDDDGFPTMCIVRMLSPDPRVYLEIAFVLDDTRYESRHNLVTANLDGEYWATSNGYPLTMQLPAIKRRYAHLDLRDLLQLHWQRINSQPMRFREVRTGEDLLAVAEEIGESAKAYQISRGYYTPVGR
jgi:hypothetical protein